MKRYLIAVLVIAVTAVAGFTLPHTLLKWQDEQRLESIEIQDADEVILTAQTDLTLVEKLQLMQKKTVTTLEMAQGKNYTDASIIVQVQQELRKLCELEILELTTLDMVYSIDRICFWIDIEDGRQSMILWEIIALSEEGNMRLVVDDETGKILSIVYSNYMTYDMVSDDIVTDYKAPETTDNDLAEVTEKWGDYLEIPLIETYDTKNPTADIDKEWQKQVDIFIEAGYSKEVAYKKVYEEWGGVADDLISWLFGVYEDESGMAAYMFRKNSGSIIFSAEPSL